MNESDKLRQYQKKPGSEVVAIQLDLETDGFCYEKWGSTQRCKPGDWIVYNNQDTYTVDAETFAKTYKKAGPGIFLKTTPVWATKASKAGSIDTKEGSSHYEKGDFIVYNDVDGRDGYAVSARLFEAMYELVR